MTENSIREQLIDSAKNHQDWRVRKKSIQQLGEYAASDVLSAISAALYDESPHVSKTAAWTLSEYGTDAIPALLQALKKRNEIAEPSVILRALGEIGDPSVIPAVIECLESDEKYLQYAAVQVITQIPDERALEPMLKLIGTVPEDVKDIIATALGSIGSPEGIPALTLMLYSNKYGTRFSSAVALGRIGNDIAAQALVEASHDAGGEIRRTAAEGLGLFSTEQAFKRLTELTQDSFPRTRAAAVKALARIDAKRAQPVLLKMLDDPDSNVQNSLHHALENLTSLDVVPILVKRYRDDIHGGHNLYGFARNRWNFPDRGETAVHEALSDLDSRNQNLRIAATWLLYAYIVNLEKESNDWDKAGKKRDDFEETDLQPRVIDTLITLLADRNDDVRLAALEALTTMGDERATTNLIKCLNHRDPLIVRKAADALANIKNQRAVQPLLDVLKRDDKLAENHTIFKRLKLFLQRRRVNRLDWITRAGIITALGIIGGNHAFHGLIELLTHSLYTTRSSTAYALGILGDQRAVPILIESLRNETHDSVRARIVSSLGHLGDKRATQAIIDVLNDQRYNNQEPGFQLPSARILALKMIRDEAALPALYWEIDNAEEWQIRMHATDAIGVIGTPRERANRLFELLEHDHETVRTTAAKRLGYLGAKTEDLELRGYIVDNLIQRLQDFGRGYHVTPTVAHMAARSLYFVGTPEANEALRTWETKRDNDD